MPTSPPSVKPPPPLRSPPQQVAVQDDGGSFERSDVVLETTMGKIGLELYWDHAPKTCKSFVELCKRKYYNNTLFHRVVPGFCIQGGDPSGTGTGGESIYGPNMEDEITPDLRHTGAGILSMANTGKPNTNGSQFFITLAPIPGLDGKNTIFGRVKFGMPVVAKIGAVQTNRQHRPNFDVKILKTFVDIGI